VSRLIFCRENHPLSSDVAFRKISLITCKVLAGNRMFQIELVDVQLRKISLITCKVLAGNRMFQIELVDVQRQCTC